jgi:hypothetical protein
MQVGSNGESNFDPAVLDTRLEAMPKAELTTAETAGLLRMREEEKLAHDVYSTLYDQWQLQAFDNISSSELTHTDAVLTLLDRYDLTDPAAGNAVGEFTNADLQSLYTSLVERGAARWSMHSRWAPRSKTRHLRPAVTATDTPDLALVYANLEKGSATTCVRSRSSSQEWRRLHALVHLTGRLRRNSQRHGARSRGERRFNELE